MSLASLVMPEGEFRIIRCDIADRILACADGDTALLYLYVLRHGGKIRNEDAMRALHMRADAFERALFTLTNLVIAAQTLPAQPAPTKPHYSMGELRDARVGDSTFSHLCDEAEQLAGRALSETMLRTLLTVYEHIKLPADVILELLHYVKSQTGSLKPRAVEQEATTWLDRGVLSLQDVSTYLIRLQAEQPLVDALLSALNIIGRAPSVAEKSIAVLCVDKGFAPDALALACARMNRQIEQPSMRYLRKILTTWDEKNIHTLAEITAAEPETQQAAATAKPVTQPTNPDQLDAWEVAWLEEVAQRKRERMEAQA